MNKKNASFEDLVKVLLNPEIDDGSRDDAAMDLSAFDALEVESALLKIASDLNANEMLSDSCGESLSIIWIRNNKFDPKLFESLNPSAKFSFMGYIKCYKSEWIEQFHLK